MSFLQRGYYFGKNKICFDSCSISVKLERSITSFLFRKTRVRPVMNFSAETGLTVLSNIILCKTLFAPSNRPVFVLKYPTVFFSAELIKGAMSHHCIFMENICRVQRERINFPLSHDNLWCFWGRSSRKMTRQVYHIWSSSKPAKV